ncbi:unnamed protein product, partial [Closterium sp. NIES-54]
TGPGGAKGVVAGDPGSEGTGAVSAVSGGAARPWPYYPASPLPGPSPYSGPNRGLTERREPESCPASPESRPESLVRAVRSGRCDPCQRPPLVPDTHYMTLRPSTAPHRVPLPSPPASSLPDGMDLESDSLSTAASALVPELVDIAAACRLDYAASLVAESKSASVCPPSAGGECALGTDVVEDRQEEFECFAAAFPHLVSMLLGPKGDPDAPDIPTPRSYAEAIEGTYLDKVPPPGANIVSGMWILRVKRPPGSPPVFKARYVARGFSQRQGVDFFQTFSPTPKMTTLWVPELVDIAAACRLDYAASLVAESKSASVCPPSAGGECALGTDVLEDRQEEFECFAAAFPHLVSMLLGPKGDPDAPDIPTPRSYAEAIEGTYLDKVPPPGANIVSGMWIFRVKRPPGSPPIFKARYVARGFSQRQGVDFFQTFSPTPKMTTLWVLRRLGFTYSSPQPTPLPTGHSLPALPSDESVEPSGPKEHMDAAKRVLRYLCSTSGMGLMLGGRARVVITSHANASWAVDYAAVVTGLHLQPWLRRCFLAVYLPVFCSQL